MLSNDSQNVVTNFVTETLNSFFTAGGFSYSIVMRYDVNVGISGPNLGMFPSTIAASAPS